MHKIHRPVPQILLVGIIFEINLSINRSNQNGARPTDLSPGSRPRKNKMTIVVHAVAIDEKKATTSPFECAAINIFSHLQLGMQRVMMRQFSVTRSSVKVTGGKFSGKTPMDAARMAAEEQLSQGDPKAVFTLSELKSNARPNSSTDSKHTYEVTKSKYGNGDPSLKRVHEGGGSNSSIANANANTNTNAIKNAIKNARENTNKNTNTNKHADTNVNMNNSNTINNTANAGVTQPQYSKDAYEDEDEDEDGYRDDSDYDEPQLGTIF